MLCHFKCEYTRRIIVYSYSNNDDCMQCASTFNKGKRRNQPINCYQPPPNSEFESIRHTKFKITKCVKIFQYIRVCFFFIKNVYISKLTEQNLNKKITLVIRTLPILFSYSNGKFNFFCNWKCVYPIIGNSVCRIRLVRSFAIFNLNHGTKTLDSK